MSKKILLIDDDDTICEIIKLLMEGEGYMVKILYHGNDLDQELKTYTPDLVIVDYLMPGKNGAEVTQYVRSRDDIKHVPIIMIAANHKYKSEGIKSGVNVFLNKPFDIYELTTIVNNFIAIHK